MSQTPQSLLSRAVILSAAILFAGGIYSLAARAYETFSDGVTRGRISWDDSAFTTDQTMVVLPEGGFAADGGTHAAPNDDSMGLLFRIDNSVGGDVDCDEGGLYDTPGVEPFDSIFRAMIRWKEQAPEAQLNFQTVCSVNFDARSTDLVADGPAMDVFDATGESFILNGFNEIIFDETPDLDIISNIVPVDPAVVVSLGFALDAGGQLLGPGGSGPISEATLFFNLSPLAPPYDLETAVTHELGHALGLGHSVGLSARALNDEVLPEEAGNRSAIDAGARGRISVMHALVFDGKTADLKADDIAALTLLYRTGAPTNVGAISGRIVDDEGRPRPGVLVVAYDDDGNELSVVTGSNALLPPDQYIIDNVPPGLYRVVLMSDAAGILDSYYDHAESEIMAARVKVAPRMETTGVDFMPTVSPLLKSTN